MALLQQQAVDPASVDPAGLPVDPTGMPVDPSGLPAGDPAADPSADPAGQEAVTPEEQAAYDEVVMAGQKVLFEDEKTSSEAKEFLKAGSDRPAETIAEYTHLLITQLDESMGNNMPEEVILPASAELMENVSDLAASIDAFPVDNKTMNRAMQLFIPDIAETYGVEDADIQEFLSSVDENTTAMAMQEGESFQQPPQPGQPPAGQPPAGQPPGVI